MTVSPKADNLPLPPLPKEKFGVISIDIPWHFRSRAPTQNHHSNRSPQRHYPTMDLEMAETLPIKQLALPDCHVMLWITGPLLAIGVHNRLFKAWGVRASSMAFVWIKTKSKFNMVQLEKTALHENDLHMSTGFTTRQNAEIVILGRIGSPARARADIRQMIIAPVQEHSRKPEEFFRRARHYGTGPYLDMFAGREHPGWTPYGWSHREDERPESAVTR